MITTEDTESTEEANPALQPQINADERGQKRTGRD
jgi:hypothetical protein